MDGNTAPSSSYRGSNGARLSRATSASRLEPGTITNQLRLYSCPPTDRNQASRQGQVQQRTCFHCNKPEHIKSQRRRLPNLCLVCGSSEHRIASCPRRRFDVPPLHGNNRSRGATALNGRPSRFELPTQINNRNIRGAHVGGRDAVHDAYHLVHGGRGDSQRTANNLQGSMRANYSRGDFMAAPPVTSHPPLYTTVTPPSFSAHLNPGMFTSVARGGASEINHEAAARFNSPEYLHQIDGASN